MCHPVFILRILFTVYCRLFAALCLHLDKHDLSLASSHVFDIAERPSMVELLEPVLRTTVLVSQVHTRILVKVH